MAKSAWTAADVPGQQGRTAVITGANTGLGLETAKVLAAKGASVVLAVRNVDKGKAAAAQITAASPGADVTVHQLDLTSLDAIRKSTDALRTRLSGIDLLINNAGVMYTPKQQTADGFELQFGTNHLGHFAFTGLLLDLLLPVPDSRVITVSSIAHPGGSNTELMRNMPAVLRALSAAIAPLITQSAAAGALPTLRAATDPNVLGGQYYGPSGLGEARGNPVLVKSSEQSHDVEIQRRLWTVSEELTGVKFPV
jgi:NAD(P)-dependent dehydrogenase (short-subunit alcohol dehydrogenase family)